MEVSLPEADIPIEPSGYTVSVSFADVEVNEDWDDEVVDCASPKGAREKAADSTSRDTTIANVLLRVNSRVLAMLSIYR